MRHLTMMLIRGNVNQCAKERLGRYTSLACIEKINADLDKIDISSDDSYLEDNDYIEAMEEENPQISFAAVL